MRPFVFALLVSCGLGCTTASPSNDHGAWRPTGRIEFEVYRAAICEDAGPSPIERCSRETYSGGLSGRGATAVQSMEPVEPDGVVTITENEVLHLADGTLTTRINAVFHSNSPDREVISFHTIVAGTGRYEGASGHIRLWGNAREDGEYHYEAVIRLAR